MTLEQGILNGLGYFYLPKETPYGFFIFIVGFFWHRGYINLRLDSSSKVGVS